MKTATIYFFRPEEGGRKALPTSTIYYATTKIENYSEHFWSIVIQFRKPLGIQEYTSTCKVSFLVDNAPFYILDKVHELLIYEGPKNVGKIILDNN